MKSSLALRAACAAAVLAVSGAAFAQTAAPAPAPAAPAAAPQPASQPNPALMTPQSPASPSAAPADKSTAGAGSAAPAATPGEVPRGRNRNGGVGKSNFMPANPDATPVLPGQGPKAQGSTGRGAGASAQGGASATPGAGPQGGKGGKGTKKGKGGQGGGMGKAFQDFQTKEELTAYTAKVHAVKTYDECKSLLETTKKELEPRAKAENKTINVNPVEVCDRMKARGRVKG